MVSAVMELCGLALADMGSAGLSWAGFGFAEMHWVVMDLAWLGLAGFVRLELAELGWNGLGGNG